VLALGDIVRADHDRDPPGGAGFSLEAPVLERRGLEVKAVGDQADRRGALAVQRMSGGAWPVSEFRRRLLNALARLLRGVAVLTVVEDGRNGRPGDTGHGGDVADRGALV